MAHRFSRSVSGWMLVLLLLAGCALMLFQGPVRAAPPRQGASVDHVVISELRFRGPLGANDEFIELYNPTAESVDISNWQVRKSSGCGATLSDLTTIPAGVVIEPGQHYLLAHNVSSVAGLADRTYSSSIADDGGVALINAAGGVVDQVGLCSTTTYREGQALPALSQNTDQGYERLLGGETSCQDTDNNAADFQKISPSQPQNTASRLSPCLQATSETPSETATPSETPTETPTFTETITPTFTSTFTETLTPTFTDTLIPSLTFTATPTAPTHLVISELRFRGPLGANDEFIELYNPTGAAVNIGGWQVRKSSGCGPTLSAVATLPGGVVLEPGQHYLLAHNASSVAGLADQTYSSGIADDGGVALATAAGVVVDQVGLCATTTYREGQTLPALSQNVDQGYERLPGGSTACYDTDDNTADFRLLSPSQPQNRSAPAVMCAGVRLYTPTSTVTPTFTRTPTRTITPVPGVVVINEFLPHARTDWNADGRVDVGDEYIEIMNVGTQSVNLRNWKLDDDVGGSSPFSLPDVTLQPRQIMRFYGSQSGILLNDGGDTVRLLRPGGQTADIFNYPAVTIFDRAWCRLPDGSGLWTFSCRPTPGRPNAPAADLGTPVPSPAAPACPLSDSLPPAILEAECGRLPVWPLRTRLGDSVWLQGTDKWGTFLH